MGMALEGFRNRSPMALHQHWIHAGFPPSPNYLQAKWNRNVCTLPGLGQNPVIWRGLLVVSTQNHKPAQVCLEGPQLCLEAVRKAAVSYLVLDPVQNRPAAGWINSPAWPPRHLQTCFHKSHYHPWNTVRTLPSPGLVWTLVPQHHSKPPNWQQETVFG